MIKSRLIDRSGQSGPLPGTLASPLCQLPIRWCTPVATAVMQ